MSGPFKIGTSVNTVTRRHQKVKLKYIRVKAGPQRDCYVHELVCQAKVVGRREAWEREFPGVPVPESEFYSLEYETVDHDNGNSLDNSPANVLPMTRAENTRRENRRNGKDRRDRKAEKVEKAKKPKWKPDPNVPF